MVDRDLILAKAGSVKRRLDRIIEKRGNDLTLFLKDLDRQEIILFNLQMAIQECIDMASHIISEEGWGVPGSTNEMFYLLEENSYLERDLTERMVRSVGFRNLMVHGYVKIEMEEVYHIAQKDIHDLYKYLSAVFSKLGLKAKA